MVQISRHDDRQLMEKTHNLWWYCVDQICLRWGKSCWGKTQSGFPSPYISFDSPEVRKRCITQLPVFTLPEPLSTSDGTFVADLDQNQILINEDVLSIASLIKSVSKATWEVVMKYTPSTPIAIEVRTIATRVGHLDTTSCVICCCSIAVITGRCSRIGDQSKEKGNDLSKYEPSLGTRGGHGASYF